MADIYGQIGIGDGEPNYIIGVFRPSVQGMLHVALRVHLSICSFDKVFKVHQERHVIASTTKIEMYILLLLTRLLSTLICPLIPLITITETTKREFVSFYET